MNLLRLAAHLVLGYLCGMWLSAYVSADLTVTAWTNVWVYFWLLLWPLGLIYHLFAWIGSVVLVVLAIVFVVLAVAIVLAGIGTWSENRKLRREARTRDEVHDARHRL